MSMHELKPGDRVRVTTMAHPSGYLRAEKGTVAYSREPSAAGDPALYAVRMDKNPAGQLVIFTADEIEPDL